jgi:ATP-dependent Zn protease
LQGLITISLGGLCAEELVFGESGTGPAGDLAHATRLAAHMVGSYGMTGSLVSFEAVEPGPVATGLVAKVLADEKGRAAVEARLDLAREAATAILRANRHLLDALAAALLERDELVGDEIIEVLRTARQAGPDEVIIPDADQDHDALEHR